MERVLMLAMATILMFWSMGLITYTTLVVYTGSIEITGPLAAIYGSTVGILSVVTGYIQKRMSDYYDKNCSRPS